MDSPGSRVSLSMGALLGEPGGGGGGGSFTGDPEGYVQKGSGNGHFSPYRTHWGTWMGAHLLGILKDEGGVKRYVKEGSGNEQLSP